MKFEVKITSTKEYKEAYEHLLKNGDSQEKAELKKLRIDSVFKSDDNHRTVKKNVCCVLYADGEIAGFEAISITRAHKGWERSMFIAKSARGYSLAAVMMEACAVFISIAYPRLKFIYSHGGTPATDAIYLHTFKMKPISWKINNGREQRAGVFKRVDGFEERLATFISKAKDKGADSLKILVDEGMSKNLEGICGPELVAEAEKKLEQLSF